jgi:cytoskeletal protein RodZ
MARNPGAARRGVDPDYVRDTVERRVDQLDLELAQGEATDDGPYLSILLNPARVTDGFAVDLSIRLFQPATLANGETVMAATWHAESFEVSTAENLQDYVRNVLQAHLETLGTDHRAANEP